MTPAKFAWKIATKTIMVVSLVAVLMISEPATQIITNAMAMTQMGNSNEMYVLMTSYQKAWAFLKASTIGAVILITGTAARDIHQYFKNQKENN